MSVRKNTVYNVVGAVVPLAVTFFTVPAYLEIVGDARFGVLALLWTVLGYFGLFDLGLGRAVTNQIAAHSGAPPIEREHVFWTALLLNAMLGLAGALVLWRAAEVLFAHWIAVPDELYGEVHAALPWMALAFPLLLTSSVMSGALAGREEFLHENVLRIAEGVLTQVVPLAVASLAGPELPALVMVVMGVRAIRVAALFSVCVWRLPTGMIPRPQRSYVRPLLAFGGWVTVTSIVGPLLSTLDRLLIGTLAGVRAVTHYTIPFDLASRMTILPGSLSSALFPRFSHNGGHEERSIILQRAVRSLAGVVTPAALVGILAMAPFLSWWVGAGVAAVSAPVGEVLVLGIWINSLAYMPYAMLQGSGRPDLVAKFHLAETVPYLLILWIALSKWGVVGAAIAWSIRAAVDAVLLFVASGVHRQVGVGLVVPAGLLGSAMLIVRVPPWHHLLRPGLGLVALMFTLWWAWLHLSDDLRSTLIPWLRSARGSASTAAGSSPHRPPITAGGHD